jgi:hypothetical protein
MTSRRLTAATCLIAFGTLWGGMAARADVVLWVDDASGNIGKVDLTTHTVSGVVNTGLGANLTDIGFNSSGTLYGTTFTALYSIDTSTGAPTSLGNYNSGGGGMNALVGSGGTTLLAASNSTTEVYLVNPTSPGSATNYAPSPLAAAGDLAFAGSTLYEAGIGDTGDELVDVSSDSIVGYFSSGGTHLTGVFGLADDGTTMYAVNGTEVYSVNIANGDLTSLFDYGGHGLGGANGTAFIGEGSPVPEPTSLVLISSGLLGLGVIRRRRT